MIRRVEENIFRLAMIVSALVVFAGAAGLLIVVALKGIPVMSWEMISQCPRGGELMGASGGVLNAIVGTLIIGLGATFLATITALPVVIFIHGYARNKNYVSAIRFALDLLWGIPSIVYGVLGFMVMLFFHLKASLLAGMITVALLEFPIAARGMDEVVRLVPRALKETAFSIGSTRAETIMKVTLRQALPGLLTALLIAFGRGVGDAASVLLTAGYSKDIPTSITDPVATLPLAIFSLLGSPYPEVRAQAYASALILTILILAISISTRSLMRRFEQKRSGG
jgi:phosphate transport system permease protein